MGMVIEANAHWTTSGMSTEELILRGHALARDLGVKISSHISGGTFSLEKGLLKHLRETGRTDVRYLMQLGVLDESWILAHCIHCTELDLEHMALVGASLVYTPTSEAIRGGGIGPVANASDLGIVTALGTDGPMVDYSDDMFEQIKACVLFQHQRHLDPTRISIERAVEMATLDGARAAGLADEIGSLDVGKQADIASLRHAATAHRRAAASAVGLRLRGQGLGREGRDGRRQDRLSRRAIHERSEARGGPPGSRETRSATLSKAPDFPIVSFRIGRCSVTTPAPVALQVHR